MITMIKLIRPFNILIELQSTKHLANRFIVKKRWHLFEKVSSLKIPNCFSRKSPDDKKTIRSPIDLINRSHCCRPLQHHPFYQKYSPQASVGTVSYQRF